MKNKAKINGCGFTLVELMVVVVIVGILSSTMVMSYNAMKEKAFNREARTALRLIRAAERQYRARMETYYPPAGNVVDPNAINGNLSVSLNSANLAFDITGGANTFTANARRLGRTLSITQANDNVTCVPAGINCN